MAWLLERSCRSTLLANMFVTDKADTRWTVVVVADKIERLVRV